MEKNKKYWTYPAEKAASEVLEKLRQDEFAEEIPLLGMLGSADNPLNAKTSRRSFLKCLGFSAAALSLASCKGRVQKAIPYVIAPPEIKTGEAVYYNTAFFNGTDRACIRVRCREGRPVRILPNTGNSRYGYVTPQVQSALLSLYDSTRLKSPEKNGEPILWQRADKDIKDFLKKKLGRKKAVLLTPPMPGFSFYEAFGRLKAHYPEIEHIAYDAIPNDGALSAAEKMYGRRSFVGRDLSGAEIIVSVGADFLQDPARPFYPSQYAEGRRPEKDRPALHIQIESNMSLSGANADRRLAVKPSEQPFVLVNLYNRVTGENIPSRPTSIDRELDEIARRIKETDGRAVVFAGENDQAVQAVALALNEKAGFRLGKIFGTACSGENDAIKKLTGRIEKGEIGALLVCGVNPVYSDPNGKRLAASLGKVEMKVFFGTHRNETSEQFDYLLPMSHPLESWDDLRLDSRTCAVCQPVISPLYDSREMLRLLLRLNDDLTDPADFIKSVWLEKVISPADGWDDVLRAGFYTYAGQTDEDIKAASVDLLPEARTLLSRVKESPLELCLYADRMGAGADMNNPWLAELPDPVSRISWDNYLTLSPRQAKELGLENRFSSKGTLTAALADVEIGGTVIEKVPVLVQPGQTYGSAGLALGYGHHTPSVKKEMRFGVNAFPLFRDGRFIQTGVSVRKTAGTHRFASVQVQNSLSGRDNLIPSLTRKTYKEGKGLSDPPTTEETWKDMHARSKEAFFNLSVDLSACIGCGACSIACQSENNIPVVGREELIRFRDMQWLRIDRYYSGDEDNPSVDFLPVMCQHCNEAPCESVCPVVATVHGSEGQSQMVYNRCVGTRFCANNCPYKVRRFNWFRYDRNPQFDYNLNNDYGRMLLNPDVVVRSRGVMEKCSMCIQITQAAKLAAKKEGRPLSDADIQPACASACPTGAIRMGNLLDKNSGINERLASRRKFVLLEKVGTKPNVFYMAQVKQNSGLSE